MDGFGYKNWDNSYDETPESTPPTYTSDPYAFSSDSRADNRARKRDVYDFDLSEDDTSPKRTFVPKKTVPTRRMSAVDRAAEILQQNKRVAAPPPPTDDDPYDSLKNSWKQLMGELDDSKIIKSPVAPSDEERPRSVSPPAKTSSRAKTFARSPLNESDSFEISEADLQVGTIAARRSQERGNERKRRQSMSAIPAKSASSPDIHNKRGSLGVGVPRSMQISSALSSIDAADGKNLLQDSKDELKRYGSTTASDAALLEALEKETPRPPAGSLTRLFSSADEHNKEDDNHSDADYSLDDFEVSDSPRRKPQPAEIAPPVSSAPPLKSSTATLRSSLSGEVRRQSVAEEILNRWKNPQAILSSVSSFGGVASAPAAVPATLTSSTSAPELATLHESEEDMKSSEIARAASDETKHPAEGAVDVGLTIAESSQEIASKPIEAAPAIAASTAAPTNEMPLTSSASSAIATMDQPQSTGVASIVETAPPLSSVATMPAVTTVQQSVASAPMVMSAEYPVSDASKVHWTSISASAVPAVSASYSSGSVPPAPPSSASSRSFDSVPPPPPKYSDNAPEHRESHQWGESVRTSRVSFDLPRPPSQHEDTAISSYSYGYGLPPHMEKKPQPILFGDTRAPAQTARPASNMSGPHRSVEIDPSLLFRSEVKQDTPVYQRVDLPVVAPTAAELHAHLARLDVAKRNQQTTGDKTQRSFASTTTASVAKRVSKERPNVVIVSSERTRGRPESNDTHRPKSRMIKASGVSKPPPPPASPSMEDEFQALNVELKALQKGDAWKQSTRRSSSLDRGLSVIKSLYEDTLKQRLELQDREISLSLREKLLESSQRIPELKAEKRTTSPAASPTVTTSAQSRIMDKINNQLVESLQNEIKALKTELYEVRKQHSRPSPPVSPEPDPAKSSQNYRFSSAVSAPKVVSDTVTVNKEKYDALCRDAEELEKVAKLYEQDNQRLLKELKEKDTQLRNRTAALYDHQAKDAFKHPERGNTDQTLKRYESALEAIAAAADSDMKSDLALAALSQMDIPAQNLDILGQVAELRKQNAELSVEISSLRGTLKWYADTQQQIDVLEGEREALKREVEKLRSEDKSEMSGRRGQRSPADIRKIRQLEKELHDAHEALRKRFPDSVSNLLYAATATTQDADKSSKQIIAQLKADLEEAHRSTDARLRGLRQEYEKMRLQYEDRIAQLTSDHATVSDRAGGIKTLNQAKSKIKELEQEIDAIKVKHAKKIESMKAAHATEISRLESRVATGALPHQGAEIQERVHQLESELNTKSQELNRVKHELEHALQMQVTQVAHQSEHPPPSAPPVDVVAITTSLQASHRQELDSLRRTLLEEAQRYAEPLKEEIRNLQSDLRDMIREKDQAFRQLHEEKSRHINEVSGLQADILTLRESARQPTTPAMHQFMALERQVTTLEQRLHRREKELQAAMDESKAAAHMERLRLVALHEQELREKDEQLVRFQSELEILIGSLRQHYGAVNDSVAVL